MIPRPEIEVRTMTQPYYYQAGEWPGRAAVPVRALVIHVMDGTLEGSWAWWQKPGKPPREQASANYLLGKNGKIVQAVDPWTEAPYANGIVNPADTNLPIALRDLLDGDPNANWVTISTELEGSPFEPGFPTTAEWAACVHLQAWLCQEFHLTPALDTVLGHRHFSSRQRANCPGPHIPLDQMAREIAAMLEPSDRYFTETGAWLRHGFHHFWRDHGGLVVFGYPITNEYAIAEEGAPGGQRTIQVFEKAVLGYHPEHAPEWSVLPRNLGRDALAAGLIPPPPA